MLLLKMVYLLLLFLLQGPSKAKKLGEVRQAPPFLTKWKQNFKKTLILGKILHTFSKNWGEQS